jgi:hypothetical protein
VALAALLFACTLWRRSALAAPLLRRKHALLPPPPPTWGYNMDRTAANGLDLTLRELVDVLGLERALEKLSADFATMRALNGTAVRPLINLDDVIPTPDLVPNATFLAALVAIVECAASQGIAVDLTGSTFERPAVAPWLHALDDAGLDAARVAFWRAVALALRGRGDDQVVVFNLVNEPIVPAADVTDGSVVTGCIAVRSNFCYLNYILRETTARFTDFMHESYATPEALATHWPDFPRPGETFERLALPAGAADPRQPDFDSFSSVAMSRWCALLSGAIKEVDPARRVTVGVQMGAEPDLTTSLACEESVDFFSVHIYPQPAFETLAVLEEYYVSLLNTLPAQQAGGPRAVVWEEYYPLSMAQGLSLEDGAVANLAASARIRAPLAVTGH